MMERLSPFRLMNTVFLGLVVSLAYGLLSWALLYFLSGESDARLFLTAYNISFKTLISLGLILGAALIIFRTQNVIPRIVEQVFVDTQLATTEYSLYKERYVSRRRSMTFAAAFILVGFLIFYCCQFPLPSPLEALMIIPACAEYALGVYVGRKLCYAGLMVHSLQTAVITRNLFKERELDGVRSEERR